MWKLAPDTIFQDSYQKRAVTGSYPLSISTRPWQRKHGAATGLGGLCAILPVCLRPLCVASIPRGASTIVSITSIIPTADVGSPEWLMAPGYWDRPFIGASVNF